MSRNPPPLPKPRRHPLDEWIARCSLRRRTACSWRGRTTSPDGAAALLRAHLVGHHPYAVHADPRLLTPQRLLREVRRYSRHSHPGTIWTGRHVRAYARGTLPPANRDSQVESSMPGVATATYGPSASETRQQGGSRIVRHPPAGMSTGMSEAPLNAGTVRPPAKPPAVVRNPGVALHERHRERHGSMRSYPGSRRGCRPAAVTAKARTVRVCVPQEL